MPLIPDFETEAQVPGQPAEPRMDPNAASQVAESLARGTAGMSDEVAAFASQYAEQKRAVAASDQMVGIDNQLGASAMNWAHAVNPATGKPDMDYSVNGFNDEANQIRQKMISGIQDPEIQNMVSEQFDQKRIVHSANVRQQSFGLEASAARGALDTQLAQLTGTAATAPTPEARAMALDDGDRAIASRSPLYLAPEEAANMRIQFRSNVQKVQALDFIKRASEDPGADRLSPLAISNYILDPNNFQGLLPSERQSISDQAIRLGRTIVSMRAADDAHNDAVAAKELTRTQAANAATLIDQVGKTAPGDKLPFDIANLSDQVRTQQLSEAGYTAILTANAKRTAGRDDPTVATDLWRRTNAGEDTTEAALEAYNSGHLARSTVTEIEKTVDARAKGGESAVDKANFNALKTALNGYAVEQGTFSAPDKAALWTQAQTEWTRRVLQGRENSDAVLSDMLQRYVKQPIGLEGLPSPREGAVNSLDDVAAVWARTKALHAAGKMDDGTYNAEAQLLDRYRQAYVDAAAAARAASANRPGGRSQSLGLNGN